MLGEIGEADKRGKTRQEVSKIDAQTAVLETERRSEKATADAKLTTTQIELDMGIKLSQIQAERTAQNKDAELSRAVEIRRAEMELEKRRANEVVKAKIDREVRQQTADAAYYTATKEADASLYREKQHGDAQKYRAMTEADAAFYAKQREAEGVAQMAKAYGDLANVLGGPAGLLQYMMVKDGVYEKLAAQNAKAINGLAPKITVWNTGCSDNAAAAAADAAGMPIRSLMQSLPPLLSTIQDQTGIRPPEWMVQMPDVDAAEAGKTNHGHGRENKGLLGGGKKITNGAGA